MGLFFNTWTEFQQQQYGIKSAFVNAFLVAFAVVLTQYFVARWIYFGSGKSGTQRNNNNNNNNNNNSDSHPVSLYAVSAFVFFYMWSSCVDIFFLTKDYDNFPLALGYQVTTPMVVVGAIPLHLLLYHWAQRWRDTDDDVNNTDDDEDDRIFTGTNNNNNTSREPYNDYQALTTSDIDIETTPVRLETETADAAADAQGQEQQPPTTARVEAVHYINNIKIFLTNMVIIHHAAWYIMSNRMIQSKEGNWGAIALQMLLGIDQSYFMNLFFFFSGYFVPKSFDRKGPYVFLLERVRRLGIPCLVYGFFLGPFGMVGSDYLLFYYFNNKGNDNNDDDVRFPNYVFTNGPQWFILHLMIFNLLYAFACDRAGWSLPKISCPSLLGFFGIALALGLCSGILSMFFPPQDEFAFVPLFWNEYPSYVVFFFGGAIAHNNRWLEEELRERPRWPIYGWAFASILAMSSFNNSFVQSSFWAGRLCTGMIFGGTNAVALGLAVTVFFMDHVNRTYNRWTRFFAKSMYTAYILHMAFPLQVATKCWILILEATNNIQYVDGDETDDSKGGFGQGMHNYYYYIENGTLVYTGFLFVALVTLLITWPTAYCIRSIPGFSKVL